MKPLHVLAIAAALALAAVLGVAAATKTSSLRASAGQASAGSISTRAHKLDLFEASLKQALRSKPPALPKIPAVRGAASASRVIYRRPAPIIIHKPSHHEEDGYESEDGRGSGGDD